MGAKKGFSSCKNNLRLNKSFGLLVFCDYFFCLQKNRRELTSFSSKTSAWAGSISHFTAVIYKCKTLQIKLQVALIKSVENK
jgi:hypothetical protein